MKLVVENNTTLSQEEYEEIRYGLGTLWADLSKMIFIFIIALFIGIISECLIFYTINSILRSQSFGVHAKTNSMCLIISTIIFIGTPFIIINYKFDIITKIIICIIGLISIYLYAPADTEKRPLLNEKKRNAFKTRSLIIGIIYSIIGLLLTTNTSNFYLMSLVISSIIINPITYKLFGQKYNNYLKYEE